MRVGVDIGGTFTDLVAADEDGITVVKVSSSPADPSRAFAEALRRIDAVPDEVLHGTTVATNAVLTRTGARLAFVTTQGFRHLLHLARQDRPSLYDLHVVRPEPLVDRELCFGVDERVGPDGSVVREIDEEAVREMFGSLRDRVDGVAVTLLHAYANPDHERRIAEIGAEVLPGVGISTSTTVLPEFREYERASTTALNAYVQPVMSRYLARIADETTGCRVGVMWSGGGVRAAERTIERPVHTVMSGPAAGVLGAAWIAERAGIDDVVTLDMGGTSTDVALIDRGVPAVAEESSLDGLPFRTPCIDVTSVGAGGGSIAWVDEGGALRVGPASAGSDPGPACYGRGGSDATVTDAQVVLGYLGAEGLAGGELPLDVAGAHRAVERLGVRAGLGPDRVAEGVLRIVRATMARAIRSVSVERGKDVRRYALVAFGGAGPLHAVPLARTLGISTIVIPPAPGALAALGLLVASRRADASTSRPTVCDRARDVELRSILHELTETVLAELRDEGVGFEQARLSLAVDCRYEGQSHELRIPVEGGSSYALLAEAFGAAHDERYGFVRRDARVEAITFRATATGPPGEVKIAMTQGNAMPQPVGLRTVEGSGVPVYARADCGAGARITGPAIVTELDSTTWIDGSASVVMHGSGAMIVRVA